MRPTKIRSVIFCGVLVALSGCQSRLKPTFLHYAQLDDAQRQAIENYYAPEAVKAREEETQGRARQWGNQFTLEAKREAEVPPPQFQYNTPEGEADRNRAQRKSNADCNCRVKPFKALKRGFGL